MSDSMTETIGRAAGWGSLGFGLMATVAPGALRKSYGDKTSSGDALDYFGRGWGTRTAVLGGLMLTAKTADERKRIASMTAAMNAADAVSAFLGDGKDMSAGTKMLAGLTSAGFAAASVYLATSS
jgi:hypothetical protein